MREDLRSQEIGDWSQGDLDASLVESMVLGTPAVAGITTPLESMVLGTPTGLKRKRSQDSPQEVLPPNQDHHHGHEVIAESQIPHVYVEDLDQDEYDPQEDMLGGESELENTGVQEEGQAVGQDVQHHSQQHHDHVPKPREVGIGKTEVHTHYHYHYDCSCRGRNHAHLDERVVEGGGGGGMEPNGQVPIPKPRPIPRPRTSLGASQDQLGGPPVVYERKREKGGATQTRPPDHPQIFPPMTNDRKRLRGLWSQDLNQDDQAPIALASRLRPVVSRGIRSRIVSLGL